MSLFYIDHGHHSTVTSFPFVVKILQFSITNFVQKISEKLLCGMDYNKNNRQMQKNDANVHKCQILFVYLRTFNSQFFLLILYMKNRILYLLCSFLSALLYGEVCHAQTMGTAFEVNMTLTDYANSPSTKTLAQKIAAREQLTNLATVYLTVPDAEGKNINDVLFKDRKNNIADYHQTTIQVVENGCNDGTERALGSFTEAGLEIKVRGNSTAEMDKRPYRLRFYKDEKDAAGNVTVSHKHDMLGYGYQKRNWTLLNNMRDGSLMQNAITYYIGQALGMPFCPGYKFVDLVINNEYRGCYQLSDHVEVGSHRIDIDENTGWFVESTRHDMTEEPFFNDAALFVLIKSPESKTEAGTAEIKQMIRQYFVNNNQSFFGIWTNACDDKTFCDPVRGWRSVYDEETLVKFYIGTNLTGDYDGLMQVKMYREENGKMHFGPLWDKDLAFGVQGGTSLAEGEGSDYGAQEFSNYIKKIKNTDPVFVKRVHDKLHQILKDGYVNNIIKEIDKLEASLLQSKKLEYENTGWKAVSVDNYPVAVERLRQYIKDHTEWFTNYIDGLYQKMGGDNIKEPDPIVNPGADPDDGPVITEPAYEQEVNSGISFGDWSYKQIPSDKFKKNATSATLKVTGAVYVCISKTNSESGAIVKYSWNDANKTGVTYELEGDNLELAKKGALYVGANNDASIKMTITNHGSDPVEPETPDTPDTPAVRQQLTDIPTIYLDAETIGDDWQQAAVEVFDRDNKLNQGVTWKKEGLSKKGNINVSVQFQGSGKAGTKSSYRLKFNDKINLMPSGTYKQWVLSSNDDDPSMIRNALAKELGDAVGMPYTPGYQFVDLYVNSEYIGTYQLTDRVKAEEGRSLVSGGNKDTDWQIQFDDKTEIKENDNAVYIDKIANAPKIVIKNPDPKDITAQQLAALKAEMTTYFTTFFGNNYNNVEANVHQQQLINWYICQEILSVYKGFSSVEAYRSVTDGAADNLVHFGPLWDSEKAFGNTGNASAIDMSDLNTDGSHKGLMIDYAAHKMMKNFFVALWTQDWFRLGVIKKWNALADAGLLTMLKEKSTAISATLAQTQPKNAKRWDNSLGNFSTYSAAVAAIGTYLDERFVYLDKKFNELAYDEVTVSTLTHAIEQLKQGKLTEDDINVIVDKLLERD